MPSDPIEATILERRLKAAADEMAIVLLQSTRSPVFHEAGDFATGVFDAEGNILQQAEFLPLLSLALQPALREVIHHFQDDVACEDIFIHNDVFSGGNQLSDVALFAPVVVEDQVLAWVGCKGHQADIGGAVQGGVNPAAREVWEEGLRIPAIRIQSRGKRIDGVWRLLLANLRLRDTVEHDLQAQIGSCVVGTRMMASLIQMYGLDRFHELCDQLLMATERQTREFIASIPNGDYSGEAKKRWNDDTPVQNADISIRTHIAVSDDSVIFDLSGSSDQTSTYANSPLATTTSAVMLGFRMLMGSQLNVNEGMLRPIKVLTRAGSVVDPLFPAATAYGNHLTDQIVESIFGSLSAVLPDRVSAGWNRLYGSYINGSDPESGRDFHDVLFLANKGGSGAVLGCDGFSHIGSIEGCGCIRSQDYERFEIHNGVTLLMHEYLIDSGGAGKWRGGLGVITKMRFDSDDSELVVYGDGLEVGAGGLNGGETGAQNSAMVCLPDGGTHRLRSDERFSGIPRGSILIKVAGGGGGYGEPAGRDRSDVVKDMRLGFISESAARHIYKLDDKSIREIAKSDAG